MRLVNRKTLPVCKTHHEMIHKGQYDGISLRALFYSFKQNGVCFNKEKAENLIKKVGNANDGSLSNNKNKNSTF